MNKYIIRYMRNDGYCTTCSFNTGAKTSASIGRAAAKAVSERCGGSIHDITMLDGRLRGKGRPNRREESDSMSNVDMVQNAAIFILALAVMVNSLTIMRRK